MDKPKKLFTIELTHEQKGQLQELAKKSSLTMASYLKMIIARNYNSLKEGKTV
jgi:predicted DNA-binding protein